MNVIHFTVDGVHAEEGVVPSDTAADVLARHGPVRVVCDQGVCGSCAVVVDGEVRTTCCMPGLHLDGSEVRTAASLAAELKALAKPGVFQCGVCAPGIVCSLAVDGAEPAQVLEGHLCRCTGYLPILRALSDPVGEPEPAEMAKLAGDKQFTMDEFAAEGMLYAAVARSPVGHGRIVQVDVSAARSMPGVRAVLTGDSVPAQRYGYLLADQPVIASGKVRYVGDIVAAVAADTPRAAQAAAAAISMEIEPLPTLDSIGEAMAGDAAVLGRDEPWEASPPTQGRFARHRFFPRPNVAYEYSIDIGEIAWSGCDWMFEDEFGYEPSAHMHLEPHVSVAAPTASGVRIICSTQRPFSIRQQIARVFGFPEDDVEVVVPRVGGGFGAKGMVRTEAIATALALVTGQPVRLEYSFGEGMLTVRQHASRIRMRTGGKRDGTLLYRTVGVILDAGAYSDASTLVLPKAVYRSFGPYRWLGVAGAGRAVLTTSVPACGFRGFGGPQAVWAGERQIDMIARRLGLDAVELRRQNLLAVGERYVGADTPMDSDLRAGLDAVVAKVQPAGRAKGSHRGFGVAVGVKDAAGIHKHVEAKASLTPEGRVRLDVGSVDIGQDVRTSLRVVASRHLDVPVDAIELPSATSTARTPADMGTVSSGSLTMMGRAVVVAVDALRERYKAEAPTGTLVALLEACEAARTQGMPPELPPGVEGLAVTGVTSTPREEEAPLGAFTPFWEVSWAAAIVEVDPATGALEVIELATAGEVGHAVQVDVCEGQEIGAAVMGLGQALFERLPGPPYGPPPEGLRTYRYPRASDAIAAGMSSQILEHGLGPGPFGAKGVGEGAILVVAPVLANALADATGVELTTAPLAPEQIWRRLNE